jgi:hypothetical protein
MEKRSEERNRVRQLISVADKMGVLNDISRGGANVSLAVLPKERKVDLTLKLNGKDINLSAVIMWARQKVTYNEKNTIGMVILDPPGDFLEYCEEIKRS